MHQYGTPAIVIAVDFVPRPSESKAKQNGTKITNILGKSKYSTQRKSLAVFVYLRKRLSILEMHWVNCNNVHVNTAVLSYSFTAFLSFAHSHGVIVKC